MEKEKILIYPANDILLKKAINISNDLNAEIVEQLPENDDIVLKVSECGLSLIGNGLELTADFSKLLNRIKKSNLQHEIIVKAVRIKGKENISVIDATAGLGEDSFILASAGFSVKMFELDPVISALLNDALDRAEKNPNTSEIANRMELIGYDSISGMKNLLFSPDVILLDPMFPERQKSAMVKKKFQLIHRLEHPCDNEDELFNAAISAKPKKIVVKRPAKGNYLAGKKPSYSLSGKAIRYDCYVYAW